jgi:glutaredoxin
MPAPNPLTVYYVPQCAFSIAAITFLVVRGVNFRAVNIEEHLQERARLARAVDRELETPTFQINDEYFVAPSLADLKRLLKKPQQGARPQPQRERQLSAPVPRTP